jgi:hypothetical protein
MKILTLKSSKSVLKIWGHYIVVTSLIFVMTGCGNTDKPPSPVSSNTDSKFLVISTSNGDVERGADGNFHVSIAPNTTTPLFVVDKEKEKMLYFAMPTGGEVKGGIDIDETSTAVGLVYQQIPIAPVTPEMVHAVQAYIKEQPEILPLARAIQQTVKKNGYFEVGAIQEQIKESIPPILARIVNKADIQAKKKITPDRIYAVSVGENHNLKNGVYTAYFDVTNRSLSWLTMDIFENGNEVTQSACPPGAGIIRPSFFTPATVALGESTFNTFLGMLHSALTNQEGITIETTEINGCTFTNVNPRTIRISADTWRAVTLNGIKIALLLIGIELHEVIKDPDIKFILLKSMTDQSSALGSAIGNHSRNDFLSITLAIAKEVAWEWIRKKFNVTEGYKKILAFVGLTGQQVGNLIAAPVVAVQGFDLGFSLGGTGTGLEYLFEIDTPVTVRFLSATENPLPVNEHRIYKAMAIGSAGNALGDINISWTTYWTEGSTNNDSDIRITYPDARSVDVVSTKPGEFILEAMVKQKNAERSADGRINTWETPLKTTKNVVVIVAPPPPPPPPPETVPEPEPPPAEEPAPKTTSPAPEPEPAPAPAPPPTDPRCQPGTVWVEEVGLCLTPWQPGEGPTGPPPG